MVAISHNKSLTEAAFTGTVTVFNSQGSTITAAATNLVLPTDWNSAHNFFVTLSGNTAGQSSASGTNLVYAGGNSITLSANTAAGAATVSISGANIVGASNYLPRYTDWGFDGNSTSFVTITNAYFRALDLRAPVSFTRVDLPVFAHSSNFSAATTATAAAAITSAMVIYTNNNSTLSPIIGASGNTTYTWASNSANWSSLTGGKYVSFPISTALVPGEYFIGWQMSTNTSSIGLSTTSLAFNLSFSCQNPANSGSSFFDFGSTASQSTNSYWAGQFTGSFTATNQTIAMSNVSVTGTNQGEANVPIIFRNY